MKVLACMDEKVKDKILVRFQLTVTYVLISVSCKILSGAYKTRTENHNNTNEWFEHSQFPAVLRNAYTGHLLKMSQVAMVCWWWRDRGSERLWLWQTLSEQQCSSHASTRSADVWSAGPHGGIYSLPTVLEQLPSLPLPARSLQRSSIHVSHIW